jgi:hypothetical protein
MCTRQPVSCKRATTETGSPRQRGQLGERCPAFGRTVDSFEGTPTRRAATTCHAGRAMSPQKANQGPQQAFLTLHAIARCAGQAIE